MERPPVSLPSYLEEGDPPSKRAVLKAALHLFVKKGYSETTIRDISAESGFTNPVLFKYWKSRDDLGLFLFERCYVAFAGALAQAARSQAPFDERLRAAVDVTVGVMDEDLDAFIFVNENLRFFWPNVQASTRKLAIPRIARDLFSDAPGLAHADAPNVMIVIASFLGTLGQFARLRYFGDLTPSATHHAPALVKLFLQMSASEHADASRR